MKFRVSSRDGEHLRDCDGSILMETILVLPLFLALLGGLFVLGVLFMGRFLQLDIDRGLAWRAADRFGPVDRTGRDWFTAIAYRQFVGRDGVDKPPKLHGYNDDGSANPVGNGWAELHKGRADVQIDVPWWTAYIDARNVMAGEDDQFQSSFMLDADGDEFFERARSVVLRRRASSNGDARTSPAVALDWVKIVTSRYAGTAVAAPPGISSAGAMPRYDRDAVAVAASGDPGG